METRSKEDFNAYMKLNRELSQVISEATERLKKGILETVKHGGVSGSGRTGTQSVAGDEGEALILIGG